MIVLRPGIFHDHPVIAALSTRGGSPGDAPFSMNLSFTVGDNPEAVRSNREQFFGGLGIGEQELAIPVQVHGTNIQAADRAGKFPATDGLITSSERLFLCISFADCLPILLFDPVSVSVGALHSGWRGTVAGIAAAGVRELTRQFGAEAANILAYVGPGAGPCCYEVGEEVAGKFDGRFVQRGKATTVDLKGSIVDQLLRAGLKGENIETSSACTVHESEYHSYRRDGGRSGRMMACIGLFRPK